MDTGQTLWILLAAALIGSWFFASGQWAKLLLVLSRRVAGLRSRSIVVDGIRWHYLEGGKGPLLVALHGFGGDADNWFRAALRLRRHFHLIAPDLPGFGESESTPSLAFDIPAQVQRLHAFLGALDAKPVALAGNSMGGWLACAYAQTHPGSLQALWLLAPLGVAGVPRSPMLEAIDQGYENPLSISTKKQYRQRVVQAMFGRVPWIPHPLMAFYAHRGIRASADAAARFRQVERSPVALETIVRGLRLPIHLQWGSRDRAVDPAGAQVLAAARPDIDVQLFEGIGHLPMLEAPRESSAQWLAFCHHHGILDS